MDTPLLTATGFAELVGVDPTTITRLCRKGRLSHYRVGTTYRLDRDVALGEMLVEARPRPVPAPRLPVETAPRTPSGTTRPAAQRLDRRSLKAELFG